MIPTDKPDVVTTKVVLATEIVNCFVAERAPSVTDTVNVDDAFDAAVGVPDTTPAELKLKPAGNVPLLTDQSNVPDPPVAVNVWLYTVPAVAGDNTFVVTAIGFTTNTVNCCVAVRPFPSVTVAVNVDVAAAVGVPDNTPPDDNDNPAGTDPTVVNHVNGAAPPDAVNDWL